MYFGLQCVNLFRNIRDINFDISLAELSHCLSHEDFQLGDLLNIIMMVGSNDALPEFCQFLLPVSFRIDVRMD